MFMLTILSNIATYSFHILLYFFFFQIQIIDWLSFLNNIQMPMLNTIKNNYKKLFGPNYELKVMAPQIRLQIKKYKILGQNNILLQLRFGNYVVSNDY